MASKNSNKCSKNSPFWFIIKIKLAKAISKFPEVMECFQITGTCDYLLRIATTDMEAYSEFYNTKLAKLPNITTVKVLLP